MSAGDYLPNPGTMVPTLPTIPQSGPGRLKMFIGNVKWLPNGNVLVPGNSSPIGYAQFAEMLKRTAEGLGVSNTDMNTVLSQAGVSYITDPSGNLVIKGNAGTTQTSPTAPNATGGSMTVTPGGAAGYSQPSGGNVGGSGGGGGGGAAGYSSQGAAWGGGGGSTPSIPGFNPMLPGGNGAGGMSWNDPLGFKNPGPGPGAIPGQGYAGGGFAYGKPRSIFDGLPKDPTYGDVVSSTLRRQEENRDAALGILGNARNEMNTDPNRVALQGRTADLLANPYSMDEATISRILGKTNEGITQRAAELRGNASDRAAAAGVGRSGSAQASLDSINNSAAGAMASGERDTRIQAAIQNQQDLRSAMGAALPVVSEKTQASNALDTTAARDVLGQSSFYGDAFLSAAMNGKSKPIGVAKPGEGYSLGSNVQYGTY